MICVDILRVNTLVFFAVLNASQIARDVLNKVVEVCKQWEQDPPLLHKSKMTYESYVHAIKNTRRKMEDRHVILLQFNNLFGFAEVNVISSNLN